MKTVIIRGPAAVGKTTIAKELARKLGALYISYDSVLKEHGLDTIEGDGIPAENFVKGDRIVLDRMRGHDLVVLDGCFYRQEQIDHLNETIGAPFMITLTAPRDECRQRNRERETDMQDRDVDAVYELVSRVSAGETITTSGKTPRQVIDEIQDLLRNEGIITT